MRNQRLIFPASLLVIAASLMLASPESVVSLIRDTPRTLDTLVVDVVPDFENTLTFVDFDESGSISDFEPFVVLGTIFEPDTNNRLGTFVCRGWFIPLQDDGDRNYMSQSYEIDGMGTIQVMGHEVGGVTGIEGLSQVIVGGTGVFKGISGQTDRLQLAGRGFRLTFVYEPNTDVIFTGTSTPRSAGVPETFNLSQNYPNPFNPSTRIEYSLRESDHVTLRIFNVNGQEVRTLLRAEMPAGQYAVTWDGLDNAGLPAASGTYLYRLETKQSTVSRKMVLVR